MPAEKVIHARELWDDGSIVELVVWKLDTPVPPCVHFYKYRLFFGARGICRVRYDNERGKGDHRHIGKLEAPLPLRFDTAAPCGLSPRREPRP